MFKKFCGVGRLSGIFLLCSLLSLSWVFCCFYRKPEDEWVIRCGDQKISSGEYVFLLNQKLMEANSKLFGSGQMGFEQKKLDYKKLEQSHMGSEGKKTFDWIRDEVKDASEKFLLVRKNFKDKGCDDSPEFGSLVEQNLPDDEDWDEVYSVLENKYHMSELGVSKRTLFKFFVNDVLKNNFILSENFGAGKPRDFSGEIPDFVKNNFVKYKIVSVTKDGSYPGYHEQNDSDGESKLEKLEGVKTPNELIEKYMEELKDGKKTLDEIGSSYNENFGGLGKQTEVPTKISYVHESEFVRDFTPSEVKKLVSEVEPSDAATLKEDAVAWHIIQRFDLSEGDVKSKWILARRILMDRETKKYFEELKANTSEPIEYNKKLLKKYSVARQVKQFIKHNPTIEDGVKKRN